jgi:membrane-associated phospholipid phosphatase
MPNIAIRFLQQNRYYFLLFFSATILALAWLLFRHKGETLLLISEQRNTGLDLFFPVITHLGDGYIFLAFSVLALFYRLRYAIVIGLIGGAVAASSALLKYFFGQPRPKVYFEEVLYKPQLVSYVPDVELHNSWTSSFPSGHTLAAFALYGFLAFCAPHQWQKIALFAVAFLVAASRLYLFQHFLADVVAGAAVGTAIASAAFLLQQKASKYKVVSSKI